MVVAATPGPTVVEAKEIGQGSRRPGPTVIEVKESGQGRGDAVPAGNRGAEGSRAHVGPTGVSGRSQLHEGGCRAWGGRPCQAELT